MSRTDITYLVAGLCGVVGTAAFFGLILVPAVAAYTRTWQRLVAAVLSMYVFASMVGVGLLGAVLVLWIWGRYG